MHSSSDACLSPAGLTHDINELEADPAHIQDAISLPNANALVSLALPADGSSPEGQGGPPLLRHCAGGELALAPSCPGRGGASPLDATFRLAAPLSGCQAGDSAAGGGACSPAATRRLLMQPAQGGGSGGEQSLHPDVNSSGAAGGRPLAGPQLVSFEAASFPGHFLTADAATGRLVLRQARGQPAAAQTFRLHPLPAGDTPDSHPFFELEPLSRPGSRFRLAADSPAGSPSLVVTPGSRAGAAPHANGAAVALRLVPPAAPAYPRGARVLHGGNRDYLLVPLGQASRDRMLAASRRRGAGKATLRIQRWWCMFPRLPGLVFCAAGLPQQLHTFLHGHVPAARQVTASAQAGLTPQVQSCLIGVSLPGLACRSWTNPTLPTLSS